MNPYISDSLMIRIIIHLENLGKSIVQPSNTNLGICSEVEILTFYEDVMLPDNFFHRIFESWPEFSGDLTYPVGSSKNSPGKAYLFTLNLWEDTEYGNARRRLCLHMAEGLRKMLKEQNEQE